MKFRNKYRAKPCVLNGIRFHSQGEAQRYQALKILERAGEISELELQPKFDLKINGVKICVYRADFKYKSKGMEIIEDFKGFKTPTYRLKKKLVKALYGIEIFESFK